MMNKIHKKKLAFAVVGIVSIALLLSGCIAPPQIESDTGDWQGKDDFEISNKRDEALLGRYNEYLENSTLAFSAKEPADGSFFEVEVVEGGVKIIGYVGSDTVVVVPEVIGEYAVVAIGAEAFSGSSIRAISLPDSITSIAKGAFAGCGTLSTMRLPFVGDGKDNKNFGYIFGADSYDKNALAVPTSLDMVILGDGVTEISENAFAGCKSISAVVLPVDIESIGAFAFYECKDLVFVSRNTAVKEIGNYAFGYCSELYKAEFLLAESIGFGAFYECDSLSAIGLPFVGGTATENRFIGYIFGAEAPEFNDNFVPRSLYSVSISARTCKDIPDRAFASCTYISEFIFDMEIESIGTRAFYACRSIQSITLPEGLKTIGDDAFFGCDNLVSVEFGDGIESIGMQAFYGCKKLESISLPDGVTEIRSSTFALCSSLKTVELNNVNKVGKDAFFKCDSLTAVDCTGIEVADGNAALVLKDEQ